MTCNKSVSSIKKISEVLKKGGIVILPTDTVYGFSGIVDFKNSTAYETDCRFRCIKGREENKPLIQLISEPEDIRKFTDVEIPSDIFKFWPGSLTVIVPLKEDSPLKTNLPTVAFRCPGDEWLRKVIKETGCPIYSTSVNRSGCPVIERIADIKKEFEGEVDFVVDDGDKIGSLPSTLVVLEDGNYRVLRQGSVIFP